MPLDKYQINEALMNSKLQMRTQFSEPRKYKVSERLEILAKPKNEYLGKDFF